jgi:hypothetical protein
LFTFVFETKLNKKIFSKRLKFQAIRTTAFLAIIHKYDEYRKYALRKPTEGQEKGAAAEGGTSSTTQNEEEEEKKEQDEEEG